MLFCVVYSNRYEVKTEGDAFMISFQHATQGLGFAIDAQSRLIEAKWPDFLLNVSVDRRIIERYILLSVLYNDVELLLHFY